MRQIKFYKSLQFKIVVGLIALLTFTMTILFIVQYYHHQKRMIVNLQERVIPNLTQMVNEVLKSSMISKNMNEMKYILEVVDKYPDVKNIFILDRVGKIFISINDEEIGKTIPMDDPTCKICHHQTTEALNKTVIYSSPKGEKVFRNVNPIYNQRECFPCHKPEDKITGVLVTDFTLSHIDRQLRSELGENIFLLFFAVGISSLALSIAMNHLVIKRLRSFVEAVSLFGQGHFNRKITFKGDDEIKRLAVHFNLMAKKLAQKMRQERKYLSQIIETQENERRRISRELHDEIGQALTAIKFNLDRIEKELPQNLPLLTERLEETKSLSKQTLAAMRQLSIDLRPTMLDDLGLIPTLRWYIQTFSNRMNIHSHFEAIGMGERLPAQIETAFYRIIQEALNNIAKHSGADHIEISLEKRDSTLYASVIDNGKGFDLEEVLHPESPKRGFGLIGMQERVTLLGGQIDIQSKPGLGTHIYINVPYPEAVKEDEEDTGPVS